MSKSTSQRKAAQSKAAQTSGASAPAATVSAESKRKTVAATVSAESKRKTRSSGPIDQKDDKDRMDDTLQTGRYVECVCIKHGEAYVLSFLELHTKKGNKSAKVIHDLLVTRGFQKTTTGTIQRELHDNKAVTHDDLEDIYDALEAAYNS